MRLGHCKPEWMLKGTMRYVTDNMRRSERTETSNCAAEDTKDRRFGVGHLALDGKLGLDVYVTHICTDHGNQEGWHKESRRECDDDD